jgi:hypothetical protein
MVTVYAHAAISTSVWGAAPGIEGEAAVKIDAGLRAALVG